MYGRYYPVQSGAFLSWKVNSAVIIDYAGFCAEHKLHPEQLPRQSLVQIVKMPHMRTVRGGWSVVGYRQRGKSCVCGVTCVFKHR